ncbi:MAG: glycoside hydrolase family 2 TIM barrel-domain containing protein [Ignavibacteria bacterium]
MILSYRSKKIYNKILYIFLILCNSGIAFSQIKVFERPTQANLKDIGLFFESETRSKIYLNGQWDISFNEGKNFSKFIVPIAFDHKGNSQFRHKFTIPEELAGSHSFIFVAEGIEYESEVKINNNFVSNHTGGFSPIIVPLSDGIISVNNEIVITVNSSLDFKNTIPLSNQINYSRIYGGINKDIYIIAVPRLFILKNYIKYSIDNLLSVKLKNFIDIKSSDLNQYRDTSKTKEFFLQTKVFKRSDNSETGVSEKKKFSIGDNNSIKDLNELTINNPVIWTPETPELYIIKTLITDKEDNIIDEQIIETGFTNLTVRNNQIFQSGKQIKLNGINYYEDQLKFASALEYSETEKDLMNIKTMGFNAVRVPGRCSHPYIVNLCNRLGLYLMQEIPFNETDEVLIENDKYVRLALNYISDMVERDKNSPCIFAWGLGNDFNVSGNAALNYVKSASALIDSVDKRFKYYTSRPYNEDICSEEVNFVGINFYGNNFEHIKTSVADLTNNKKPSENRKNRNLFVSAYGLNIQNSNANGFSDIKSQEAQMKFLNECYGKISQTIFGNFISSYADWNSEDPLNFPMDSNNYLKTNGLFTIGREQKRSTDFVKRVLNNEDLPRIQEGNNVPEFPYIFLIAGITMIVILVYFINRDRKFRSGLIRCLYKPTYFFSLVKDQMIIPTGYNLLLSLSISVGLALFFASIFYFYRENNSFDMVLAKIFTNDNLKTTFSNIVNNKFYLITTLTALNLFLTFLTALLLYFISFYTKGRSYFKNIYTVCVWSTLPMIFFLFVGTVLYKIAETNPSFIKISLWIFFILYILYLNRIIMGTKSLFELRTGKVYLYGIIIIFVIFAIIYSYFSFFTGALETMDLVSYLTNN